MYPAKARLALACGLMIAVGMAARAQLSVGDLRNMSPSVEELNPARMTAFTGLTVIDGDPYWRVDLRPDLSFGRLGIGMKGVLLIGTPENEDGTKLLTEDGEEWDSFGSFLRSVRYVRWAYPRSPFYALYGELFDVNIGHGMLMEGYSNLDRRGARLNVNRRVWGLESVLNNIDNPELFGARAYFRPLRLANIETPILNRLAVGASYLTDVDPIPSHEDEDALQTYALDASIPIISTDSLLVEVYDELAFESLPVLGAESEDVSGNAVGIGLEVSKLHAKLEYRTFDAGFEPSLFDYNYEARARTADLLEGGVQGIQFNPANDATKGVFGKASLNVLDQVHLSGLYEDYDGDGPNSDPKLGLRLVETDLIQEVDLRAFYIKRGISSSDDESFLEDLVDLDEKSLFIVEVAYNIAGPVQVLVTREFRFRERKDEDGFETIQKTNVQIGLSLGY
ncbi:hypothetical protein HOK31_24480 [Candidatus Poribacteria bacterium]|jgi:hypothetical protein|nr:hypothetical protein [Candidatus Poribacteria bacterium]